MPLRIVTEANRCLQCKKPQCVQGCPAATPIPEIIRLFRENRNMEAGAILFANNPLSVICSIVCDHEAQCAGHCVLGKKGSPVLFYKIEEYLSDSYLDRMEQSPVPKKNISAAVIGAGPSGMTVAVILALNGYSVTLFDDNDHIGGMLQYGIPEFRLSKTYLQRYQKVMDRLGIQFRPKTAVGEALTIDQLQRDGYKSIFIGTGVWIPKKLGIVGESLPNVHFGISFLSNPDAYRLGRSVAVIGMGNVAMDVARTALRHGAQEVTLYARSKRIAASEHELQYAMLDGAELVFGRAIERITPEGPVFKVAVFDEEDHITGYLDEEEQVHADSTVIAVSQAPKNKLVLTTKGLLPTERGLLATDENCMTTRPGVFAAGDVVHGSNTVVAAVEEAKRAARAMIEYMESHERSNG